jgi:uncharacterized membrane protein YgdD (TMEM256/DUF423 family)
VASWIGTIGAVLGAVGVAMGAFGAHALKDTVEPRMLDIWSTATQYQLWHALALVAVALLAGREGANTTAVQVAGGAFTFGVLVFSGSLFLLVLTGKTWLGAITPIGGTALIVGWIALAVALAP